MGWRDYPLTPCPGTAICPVDAVKDVKTIDLDGFLIILVATPLGMRAFVNLCPHQFLPLDYRSSTILSADGSRLICSSHQAMFAVTTGAVLAGPAETCLDPIPLTEQDGILFIG